MLELMPHQKTGVTFLKQTPRALLADEPGIGKTAQALLAAVPPVLVVTPAMLSGVWADEVALWRPEWTEDDWTWISYSSLCERVTAVAESGRKTSKALDRAKWQLREREWGTIVYDEAHYLKSRKAKWTKAALGLRSERMVMLTGTPIPNWSHELYVLLRLLHGVKDVDYRSYWRFIETWFTWWNPPWGDGRQREIGGLKGGLTWEDFAVGTGLDKLMLRRLRNDVLKDLPPLTEQTILVKMGPAQRKAYNELKKDYYTFVEEAGEEVAAFSDGGLYVKLAKMTTGIPVALELPTMQHGSAKLDALRELLQEREGSPVVVFCHFRATAACCVDLGICEGRKVGLIMGGLAQAERDETLTAFSVGELDMMVGTYGAMSEGINKLVAADTAIMIEEQWRPDKMDQAIRRLHRIGQKRPVSVIHLITEDSLDQNIRSLRFAKEGQQIATLRAAEFASLL
jgi:SNF2 family DNA or RNA helicase